MWLRDWEPYFDDGDRLQVVVGFNAEVKPSGGRQIFKGSLAVKDLSKLSERFSPEIFIQAGGECRLLVNWAALSKSIP